MAQRKRGFIRKWVHRHHRSVWVVVLAVGFFITGAVVLWAASIKIPDFDTRVERKIEQSTKIYDRTGEVLLFDINRDIQRTLVPIDEISRNIKNATVAIEDAEFYQHRGVKISATFRAIVTNLINADIFSGQGGSTITQQVVKNSLLVREKLISRKIKEWVLALKLERNLTKEDILELYLNETPYGGTIYGVEEASQTFFGKSAREVTVGEAAYLAALPQAPTFYSPYGDNTDVLETRKNLVLSRMRDDGFLTREEYEGALEEEVVFLPRSATSIVAPHFVMYVRELLSERFGQRALEERGFRVITSLDHTLQERAQEIVTRHALKNVEDFDAENASLTALDPKTGDILVMVGSRDFFDADIDGEFNIALAKRQPGSAFKPFVYATALKKGYTTESMVFDLPTQFSSTCSPDDLTSEDDCYSPQNYDFEYRGPMTFRDALAQSVNVPAVKVLYLAGLTDSLRTARDLGIGTLTDVNRYGLTLVLGGGEVMPLEMASAYGVFANEGIRNEPRAILRIEDSDGMVIENFEPRSRRVLERDIALSISDILSDNEARTPAFGTHSPLFFSRTDVAAKTGTTNDSRDAWIVGYTPTLSVAAWAGNNDNSPMVKQVAGFIVAPLWREFMDVALAQRPVASFPTPSEQDTDHLKPMLRGRWEGNTSYIIDTVSGKLATKHTPEATREERIVVNPHTILHWVDDDNPLGSPPSKPEKDPQYIRWEFPVAAWVANEGITRQTNSVIPTEIDDVHRSGTTLSLRLNNLEDSYVFNERVLTTVSSRGGTLASVDIFINNTYLGRIHTAPFTITFTPEDVADIQINNTLRVVGTDTLGNTDEVTYTFSVTGS